MRYSRPLLLPDGRGVEYVLLEECTCNNRRGPEGGVCGCGGAIPKKEKQPAASTLVGNNTENKVQSND